MYEVEYKVEITKEENEKLVALFKSRNFVYKETNLQNDYYVEVRKSPLGGFDFKRYRKEGEKAFYTEKVWEEVGGKNIRREAERELSPDELLKEIEKYPDCVKIKKERQSFSGRYENQEIHIDMDSVKFDHSPSTRYFIEAEVLTNGKEDLEKFRNLVTTFLKESLERSEIIESPGMFDMAFKKM